MEAAVVEESSFREYAQVLWRRRWTVIVVTLAGIVLALLYSGLSTKVYNGKATLLLTPPLPTAALQARSGSYTPSIVDVPTSIQVMESTAVSQLAEKTLGRAVPPVTVTQVGTTDVVQVVVGASDPSFAAKAANAYANAYLTLQRQQIQASLSTAQQQLNQHLASVQSAISQVSSEITQGNAAAVQGELSAVQASLESEQSTLQDEIASYQSFVTDQSLEAGQLITPATPPGAPAKPRTSENTVFGFLIGLILGIALAMVMEAFSRPAAGATVPAVVADGGTPPVRTVSGEPAKGTPVESRV